jgi:hypothetical protein
MRVVDDPLSVEFPPEVRKGPTTIYLWGTSRPVLNLTLFAIARFLNPRFHWLDIREPDVAAAPTDPVRLGWVAEDRLFLVDCPRSLELGPEVPRDSVRRVVRSDEPDEVIADLSSFIRLPSISQEIAASAARGSRPGVLAASNTDRITAFYPSTAEGVRPLLSVMTRRGISIVFAHTGQPSAHRQAYDYIFAVDAPGPERWREGGILCEKGISQGPLRVGNPVPLQRIAVVAQTFERAVLGLGPDLAR